MSGNSLYAVGEPHATRNLDLDRPEPRRPGGSNSKTYWRRLKAVEDAVADLQTRVSTLESLLTPEQVAQLDLIRKAERVINVARAEGQLPPIEEQPPL